MHPMVWIWMENNDMLFAVCHLALCVPASALPLYRLGSLPATVQPVLKVSEPPPSTGQRIFAPSVLTQPALSGGGDSVPLLHSTLQLL